MTQFTHDSILLLGIEHFKSLSKYDKRESVVKFVDKKFAHKPENYRKVVVCNMLKDLS